MRVVPMAEPKMAHVNLMTDTIIANLPEDALRCILRSMLATDPSITPVLEQRTKVYLAKASQAVRRPLFQNGSTTEAFQRTQQILRSMLGCGMSFESLPLLTWIVEQTTELPQPLLTPLTQPLFSIDGDIIQAITAIQKSLTITNGTRELTKHERLPVADLFRALLECRQASQSINYDFPFERSLSALRVSGLVTVEISQSMSINGSAVTIIPSLPTNIETFQLGNRTVPRLFSGLWQLSSPSWGITSTSKINAQFQAYTSQGFTAFDMADHYGDAEIVFGTFRSRCSTPDAIFGATKYCIFTPITITESVMRANVKERCQRMCADHVDLLQFHWQFYDDPQYIQALKYLQTDNRVHMLGLCNFDTEHMLHIFKAGIKIHTNQVQFSLIDSRPAFRMGAACTKYDVKLLTYGTLLGGFIAEKWLDRPEPELFEECTPSQRKYYEMILNWGGWSLFQDLLRVLEKVAGKHNVSISNVATRWVLDFPYVGAVIVGTRWGVSDNAEDNLRCYGVRLDDHDQDAIEEVLRRSNREDMIDMLGDCGGEYR